MNVFDFDDSRDFLKSYLKTLPNKGYGKLAEIAEFCQMNPATLSLVMQKERDFTIDQADDVCRYLGLGNIEADYFLNLVQRQRAGRPALRERISERLLELREKSKNVQERLKKTKVLDEATKSQFYSNWYYSAIRIATSVPELNTVDALTERFQLPRHLVQRTTDFLLENGLVVEIEGKLQSGVQRTHLGPDSPLVGRHHTNWRLKAIEKVNIMKTDEMFFTSPVSIAEKDIPVVRQILLRAIEEAFKVIHPSQEEDLACLNIDWFRI